MTMQASGIGIDPTLAGALGGAGSPGYNASKKIGQNYAGAGSNFAADASARGMNGAAATGPNSYYGSQAATKQGLDTGNLESALGGGLGNTAYTSALQNRDYQQQMQLAKQVGSQAGLSSLEQALGATGAVGGAAAKIYGATQPNPATASTVNPTYSSTPAPTSLWGAGGYNPYAGYDDEDLQGYQLQPNMLNNYGAGGGN